MGRFKPHVYDEIFYPIGWIFSFLHYPITVFSPLVLHDLFMELIVAIILGMCLYSLSLSVGEDMPVLIFVSPTPAFAYLLWNKLGQAYRALENSDLFDSDDKVYAVSEDKEAEILDQEEESIWGETTPFAKPEVRKSVDTDTEDEGGVLADDEDSDYLDDRTISTKASSKFIVSVPGEYRNNQLPSISAYHRRPHRLDPIKEKHIPTEEELLEKEIQDLKAQLYAKRLKLSDVVVIQDFEAAVIVKKECTEIEMKLMDLGYDAIMIENLMNDDQSILTESSLEDHNSLTGTYVSKKKKHRRKGNGHKRHHRRKNKDEISTALAPFPEAPAEIEGFDPIDDVFDGLPDGERERRMESSEGHHYGPGTGRRRPKTPVLGEAPLSEVLAHLGSDEDNDNSVISTGEGLFVGRTNEKDNSEHSLTAYDSGKASADNQSVRSSVKSFQWIENHARPVSRSRSRGGEREDPTSNNEPSANSVDVDDSHLKEVLHEDEQKRFSKPRILSASGGIRTVKVSPSPVKATRHPDNDISMNEEDMKVLGLETTPSPVKQSDDIDGDDEHGSGVGSPSAKKLPSPGHYVSEEGERKVEDLIKIAEEFDKLPENKKLSSYANIPKTPGWGNDDEMLVEDV